MKLPDCEVNDKTKMEKAWPLSPEFPEELSQSRMHQLKADYKNGNLNLKPQGSNSVRVWVGTSAILMHADLLAASSTVFRDLLKNDLSRSGPHGSSYSVSLQTELEVFRLVKHYLYCDLFGQEVKIELAFKILDFSLYYDVPRLITPAVQIILGKMEPDHSLCALEVSKVWGIPELEKRALEIIAENAETILATKKFKTMGSYDVIRILSLDGLSCTEEQVFDAAVGWAQYGQRKKSQKYYFSQVEKCIRFPLMTPSQLAVVTAKADLMDPTDMAKLFQYTCLPASDKGSIEIDYNTNARTKKAASPVTTIPTPPKPTSSTKKKTLEETICTPTSSGSPEAKRRRISIPLGSDTSGQSSSITSSMIETPAPATSNVESAGPSGIVSDSEGEDLFTVVTKDKIIEGKEAQSYEDLFRRYTRFKQEEGEGISGLHFNDAKFVQNYRVVELQNCKSLKIDAQCKFLKIVNDDDDPTFFRGFVSRFDPMRFLSVSRDLNELPTPKNIWSLSLDILLKFNGVTFLKVQHAKENEKDGLVLNYISDSLEVLKNEEFKPSTLAISNCEFSMKTLEAGSRAKNLEKLVLYRVWGEFTLDEIMKECPCLTELRLWKHMPVNSWFKEAESFLEPPSLHFAANSFAARNTLKKLSLHKTQLKFKGRVRALCLEELWLEECYMYNRTRIDDFFHDTFPSLKKLVLKEKEKTEKKGYIDMATSRFLNCVLTKIKTIEWIRVVGMTWKIEAEDEEDVQLSSFLKKAGLVGRPESFVIEKVGGGWKGTNLDTNLLNDQEDNMEYEWYDLVNFFDSCECFEDYFIQDSDFPRPQLRY